MRNLETAAKLALAVALMAFAGADSASWERCAPQPSEIFSGVTYGCERLERSEQGRGVFHWVRVELGAPGIELYVTPLDPLRPRTAFSTDCGGSTMS